MKKFLLFLNLIVFVFDIGVWGQSNQTVNNGDNTTAVSFSTSGCVFNWVNSNPAIGLPASGTGSISSFNAVNTGNTPITATIIATPAPSGFAYICNSGDNTVSVISLASQKVVATIPVRASPNGEWISNDGLRVYTLNYPNGTASVISTVTNTVTQTIATGEGSYTIAESPNGAQIYVTNVNGTVNVINRADNSIAATITVGETPSGLAFSVDGSTLYVGNSGSNSISVINTTTYTVIKTIPVDPSPGQFALSPDGKSLFVVNDNYGELTVINTTTNSIISVIPGIALAPAGIAVSPDGNKIYTADQDQEVYSIIDAHTYQLLSVVELLPGVDKHSIELQVSPDGTQLWVVNLDSGTVDVYNTTTNTIEFTVPVGTLPGAPNNFILPGFNCGSSTTSFTITVKPKALSPPTITTTQATGSISACAGTASVSPQVQQFTVNGSNLTANITATAPTGFEISLSASGGFASSLILNQSSGSVSTATIYVCSSATAATGNISGNITLSSAGAANQSIAVNGVVNALATINIVPNQTITNGSSTTAVNFSGTATVYNWVNDSPVIGLPASGEGNIPSFTAVNGETIPVTATIEVTPVLPPIAYIPNSGNGTVSVINTSNQQVIATILVGQGPQAVAINPNGAAVYVGNISDGTVSVINTQTNTVSATIQVAAPAGLAVSLNGTFLYVVSTTSSTVSSVSVINLTNNNIVANIPVGAGAGAIVLSPDGAEAYVLDQNAASISVISTSTNTVISTIPVGGGLNQMAISPDGLLIYATADYGDMVTVVSTVTDKVIKTITLPSTLWGITFNPAGTLVYVVGAANAVYVIDPSTGQLISTIQLQEVNGPISIAITPDGNLLYVTGDSSNNVLVVDLKTQTVVYAITIGSQPVPTGNFISNGSGCQGSPTKFTITVNPTAGAAPTIAASSPTGTISACQGTDSQSPEVQQFHVSGSSLKGNITLYAPTNFQISTASNVGFASSLTLSQQSGAVSNTVIYVRSATGTGAGSISGNVLLTSSGAVNVNVPVVGTVNPLPSVTPVSNQAVASGSATSPISFSGSNNTVSWTNDTPSIGLPVSGTGNISSFNAVNNNYSAIAATITATPALSGFAYVPNETDGTVSVINTSTNTVIQTIRVGNQPKAVVVSPDGSSVYVANFDDNTISVIATNSNTVVASIYLPGTPLCIAVSPDGKQLYACSQQNDTVYQISTATNSITGTIPVGNYPSGLVVSADGKWVYLVNSVYPLTPGSVTVINTTTDLVATSITVGYNPAYIAISPQGDRVYVTNYASNTVSVISTANNMVIDTVAVDLNPNALVVSPDGSRVYVSNYSSNDVSVINTNTYEVMANIPVSAAPYGESISSDGNTLYVTGIIYSVVSVVNTATNQQTATIPVGQTPVAVGNFVLPGTACTGPPDTFTITVYPASASPPTIVTTPATGIISACAGTASASPDVQQLTISGSSLTGNISVTAPNNFQISTSPTSGYSATLTLAQQGGMVSNTVIYVCSAATALTGGISGNLEITSPGAQSQEILVTGTVIVLPIVNAVPDQTVVSGSVTTAITFSGTANSYSWSNSTSAIGLAASGTGNIAPFTAIDTASTPVTATITVGPLNTGFLYAANISSNTLSVINTSYGDIAATINMPEDPNVMAISPDGSRLYVAGDTSVTIVNTSTNQIVGLIKSISPDGLALSPDGSVLYVADIQSNQVDFYNASTYALISATATGQFPAIICLSANGNTLYVTNYSSNTVSVINTATAITIATIPVGLNPIGIALNPTGNFLYVANQGGNSVSVISTTTNSVTQTISVGLNPFAVTVGSGGNYVYVSNKTSGTVSVISTYANTVSATIPGFNGPAGLLLGSDGSELFVTNQSAGNVTVVNTATNQAEDTLPAGSQPIALALLNSGTNCPGTPVKFTITVNPAPAVPPAITAAPATGTISACAGTASTSPSLQQVNISGSNLTGNISVTAPNNFQISATPTSGYSTTLTLAPQGGTVNNTIIYVSSAATAPAGSISGNLQISSPGAQSQEIPVTGTVTVSPIVNAVADQTVTNGTATAAITFSGTANKYNWVNSVPGIGLASSGTGNISPFTVINKGTSPITASITVTPENNNLLYVANFGANTVWEIDPADNSLVGTINVGLEPTTMTLSPDGSKLYVVGDTSVSVISTANNHVIKTIGSLLAPSDVALSPDGAILYICSFGGNEIDFFNSSTYKLISTVTTEQFPGKICLSADGSTLYVTNYGSNSVSVINTATGTSITTIPVGINPEGLALNPAGTLLYVTNQGGHSVSVINTSTNAVSQVIQVGNSPTDVVVNSTGNFIYICNKSTGTISVISAVTNTVTATISGFNNPASLLLSPDGTKLYVANQGGGNVKVVDVTTRTVTSTLATNSQPIGLALLNNAANCPGIPATFTIIVNPGTSAATITATGQLQPLTTIYGTSSASESFMVSAQSLTSGILVTPPPGFEVSTDNTNFSAMVTEGAGGNIATEPLYIRLAAASPVDNYSGNIILTSPDAPSVNETMPISTVTPAPLSIIADDKIRPLDKPNPNLTASYVGFVNFDTPEQLTSLPVLATTAITTSRAGTYPITVSGASAINYTITYLAGTLTIQPSESAIIIPNTFTPNGDGVNDTWDIKYLDTYATCSVDIFTRWGQKVYSSTGYPIPWDGTYRGAALPTGTYYYIINLKNGLNPLSGFVAIVH
jgi:gliding motility-associated-like protein